MVTMTGLNLVSYLVNSTASLRDYYWVNSMEMNLVN